MRRWELVTTRTERTSKMSLPLGAPRVHAEGHIFFLNPEDAKVRFGLVLLGHTGLRVGYLHRAAPTVPCGAPPLASCRSEWKSRTLVPCVELLIYQMMSLQPSQLEPS